MTQREATGAAWSRLCKDWREGLPMLECRTSGSTGKPKKILLPRLAIEESARRTIDFFGLGKESRLHSCISPDYIGGKMMVIRAMECGGAFTWELPGNRPLRGENKDSLRIDLLAVVPSQVVDMLGRLDSLPHIGAVLIGGSAIDPALRRKIAASGLPAWETYGMTETASHIALRRVEENPGPFKPLPGISVESGPEGAISVKVPWLRKIVTNDLGTVSPDGTFTVTGRRDNIIVSGGKKVNPEQIEAVVEAATGCTALAYGVADEKWGQRVELTVEPCRGRESEGQESLEAAAMSACRAALPPEAVPKRIQTGTVPLTPNGKKLRRSD